MPTCRALPPTLCLDAGQSPAANEGGKGNRANNG